ncbi:MAG: prolyl oligopeptidase family serine peptidase [Myxococcales bacterium]|nr:prolyl oligopeptidase family serine peptidase [Myxococcales bacterium]
MRATPIPFLFLIVAACSLTTSTVAPVTPARSSAEGTSSPWPEVAAAPVASLRTDARPLPRDIAARRRVMDVRIAPDGSRVAYVVRIPRLDAEASPSGDEDQDGGWEVETQLFVVDRAGGAPLQLTFGDAGVARPRWSPDGRDLAFLRGGHLSVIHLGGGEARVVEIEGDLEPQGFEWAPDGRSFALLATRRPADEVRAARFHAGGARRYDREWEPVHLFVVPREGGEARHVNQGAASVRSFAWAPDGERFALVTAPSSDPYVGITQNTLQIVSARDGSEIAVVEGEPRPLGEPAWSPDGSRLAYEAVDGGFVPNQLVVYGVEAGTKTVVTEGLDPTMAGFAWMGDSASLIAHVEARTRSALYRVRADGSGRERVEHGARALYGVDADRAGRYLVSVGSSPTEPPDPVVVDTSSGQLRVLASIHPQVAEWSLPTAEVVRWENAEGIALEGVYYRSALAGDGPAPLLVLPHGGPDSVSREEWSDWAVYFAARGYSVLRPNYRGGTAYGRDFYAANRGRLGEIELMDIESGVDALVAAGRADPERLFYGGWSWGGYLSAWTLGHTSRYRAHVVGAGVVDVAVQYSTSDINHGVVADWEFRGRPWREPETFARANPAAFLHQARQPTLILHGERDTRVAFVNGQMLYRALEDAGCEVEMYAYPRENHGFHEPAHVEHVLTAWAAWYDAHLP